MQTHRGDWMQTASGRQVWVLEPDPLCISIVDIAHHLAQLPRYCGAAPFPYSVAQHCVLVSYRVEQLMALRQPPPTEEQVNAASLGGLLHDAAEAYLLDVHRPLKRSLSIADLGVSYRDFEEVWLASILTRFRVPALVPEVYRADEELLATESVQLFPKKPADWELRREPLEGVALKQWTWETAKHNFLARFGELGGRA